MWNPAETEQNSTCTELDNKTDVVRIAITDKELIWECIILLVKEVKVLTAMF